MPGKITADQESIIVSLVRDTVHALGLSEDEAQEIIKAGGTLQEQVKSILQKLAIIDQRFGPAVKDFEFTVPADYEHDTQLDTFAKKTKELETTYYFNDALTSENFAKATTKLEPGKKYRVRIFPILATVTSEDCMNFLAKQNAILVGGQGVMLLQDQKADEFPVDKYTVSFDQKDALWTESGGFHMVPRVYRYSGDGWWFGLGYFERDWSGNHCLSCFCEA